MTDNRKGLKCPMNAKELLDMYFLDIRSHLLEAASGLDRIERADTTGEMLKDKRIQDLIVALDILKEGGCDRAERFLKQFSV